MSSGKAMRAMFRDDKVVIAELDRFARASRGRNRKPKEEAEAAA
jgi:hypothetical protein